MSFNLLTKINNLETLTDAAFDTKANTFNPTFTGIATFQGAEARFNSPVSFTYTGNTDGTKVSGLSNKDVGLGNVDNTSDTSKPISTLAQAALNLKAPKESPTFTGTVSGISKPMVGLGNVDNTSDTSKPISALTQTALDLKAPKESPTFTGTVNGISKTMVGLGNVNNTSDIDKPLSTAVMQIIERIQSEGATGPTNTNLYINDLLQIKQKGAVGQLIGVSPTSVQIYPQTSTRILTVTDTFRVMNNTTETQVLSVNALGITPYTIITPNNGYLYNKGEIDSTVNYLTQRVLDKQDTLSPYSSISSGDNPPSSSSIKSLLVYASNPTPELPGRIVPCIRALTLPPGSLLRFQETNLNSPWLGIDDSLITSSLNNRYTIGEIDLRFRQKTDVVGFSDIPILNTAFTVINGGLKLLGSAFGASTSSVLDGTYAGKITLSPMNDGIGYYLVDENSFSYPIGGSSNISVSQNPISKQLTVDLTSSVTATTLRATNLTTTNLTITNNLSLTKSDYGIPTVYAVPPNYGNGGWYNIGYYKSTYDNTTDCDIMMTFCGHSYTNFGNATEDSIVIFRFKMSAATFGGNGQAYRLGKQLYSPDTIRVVRDATDATKFTFYASYRPYARGSFVQVSCPTAFTPTGTFSATAPTGNYIDISTFQIYSAESPQPAPPAPHVYEIPELQQIFGLANGSYYMDGNYIFDTSTSTYGLIDIVQNYITSQFASQSTSITTNPTFIGNTNINNGVLSITGTSTNTGTIRIAPYNSGNESSIGFYRNYDYSQNPSFSGEKWVIGTNVYNGGQRVFAIGCDAQYACLTISGTNGVVNAIKGLTAASITLSGTDLATTLGTCARTASPTFTGTVTAPTINATTALQAGGININTIYAPLASPTFTGTVSGITKAMVGLGSVDNTSDISKPISTAVQTSLNLKANTSDLSIYLTTATANTTYQTISGMSSYAQLASPTFTGTVAGITKAMVGLSSVDNTSDASKPISTAVQTALTAKASLSGATFTGQVNGITKAMVGLANVDNTSDVDKPVSTAVNTALSSKMSTPWVAGVIADYAQPFTSFYTTYSVSRVPGYGTGTYRITYAAKSGTTSVVAIGTPSGSATSTTFLCTGTANTTTVDFYVRNGSNTLADAYIHFTIWAF